MSYNEPQDPKDGHGGPPQYGAGPEYGQGPGQGGGQQYGQYGGAPQYSGGSGGEPPKNYLVWSILSTLFCCLPLGIASIVFAAQVNGKWASGDQQGAVVSSEKAKKFAIWSAIAGVVVGVIYGIVIGIARSSSSS